MYSKTIYTVIFIIFIQLMYNKNDHLAKWSFLSDI